MRSMHDYGTLSRFMSWARDTFGHDWNLESDYAALRYLASIPDHAMIHVVTSAGDLTIEWNIIDGTGRGRERFLKTSPELRVALKRYQDSVANGYQAATTPPDETI